MGNAIGTTDSFGNTSSQTFDGDYNPLVKTDRDGNTITNGYDGLNQLTSQSQLAANGAPSDSLLFGYDKNNNMTLAQSNYGSYTFTPDPANFITQQKDPFNLTLTFTPDADYNVSKVVDSAGGTQNNTFDTADRLSSRNYTNGGTQLGLKFTYKPTNEIDTVQRFSDAAFTTQVGQSQYGYDGLGITSSVVHTTGATTLESFSYTIDNAGMSRSETDNINGTITTTGYGYDAANQMTSAGSATYNFDLNGNRNTGGFVVGAGNQLQSDGNWNFGYDPEGNLTKKTGIGANAGLIWVLSYNAANQLVGATETNNGSPVVAETNQYDVFGNLIEQDVSLNGGQPTITKFAHQVVNNDASDGGQDPVWADLNASNQVQTTRIWALDQVFARIAQSGTEDWYLPDRLGSIRGLMNNSGTLDDTINFDAIGNKTSESNPTNGDRFGYVGAPFDANLQAYNELNRWFTPYDQTWLSQDPLGLTAGPNPYTYVSNAPVNFTDPTGLQGYGGPGGGSGHGMMPFPGGSGGGRGVYAPSPFSNGGAFEGFRGPPAPSSSSRYSSLGINSGTGALGTGMNASPFGGSNTMVPAQSGGQPFGEWLIDVFWMLVDLPGNIASELWDIPHGWGADLGLWERRAPNSFLNPGTRMLIGLGTGSMQVGPRAARGLGAVRTVPPPVAAAGLTAQEIGQLARRYAAIRNSNEVFRWRNVRQAALTEQQRSVIRNYARDAGLIAGYDRIRWYGPNNQYADFSAVAYRFPAPGGGTRTTVSLPENLINAGPTAQRGWLNRTFFGGTNNQPGGWVWHHMAERGQMQLVPRGVHGVAQPHIGTASWVQQ